MPTGWCITNGEMTGGSTRYSPRFEIGNSAVRVPQLLAVKSGGIARYFNQLFGNAFAIVVGGGFTRFT
jgi:hypothetical protein